MPNKCQLFWTLHHVWMLYQTGGQNSFHANLAHYFRHGWVECPMCFHPLQPTWAGNILEKDLNSPTFHTTAQIRVDIRVTSNSISGYPIDKLCTLVTSFIPPCTNICVVIRLSIEGAIKSMIDFPLNMINNGKSIMKCALFFNVYNVVWNRCHWRFYDICVNGGFRIIACICLLVQVMKIWFLGNKKKGVK